MASCAAIFLSVALADKNAGGAGLRPARYAGIREALMFWAWAVIIKECILLAFEVFPVMFNGIVVHAAATRFDYAHTVSCIHFYLTDLALSMIEVVIILSLGAIYKRCPWLKTCSKTGIMLLVAVYAELGNLAKMILPYPVPDSDMTDTADIVWAIGTEAYSSVYRGSSVWSYVFARLQPVATVVLPIIAAGVIVFLCFVSVKCIRKYGV
jgi:hypothetical protein